MKKLTILALAVILSTACNQKATTTPKKVETPATSTTSKPEQTQTKTETVTPEEVVYTCPMHSEVIGKKGEKCPKCGMDLVPKK